MSDSISNNEIDRQLDHCFKALKAFRRTVRERKWARLPDVRTEFDKQIEKLKERLGSSGPIDGESETAIRLRQLEIEVRRIQRQLSLHMSDVREDIETLETGIRKVQKVQKVLDTDH